VRERRFRALLVGVEQYRDSYSFRPMPFITAELRGLADALQAAGYQKPDVLKADDLHGTQILSEVGRFLREASAGDHLLLVLSGHGMHEEGSDYLVTGPAEFEDPHFLATCLRIEFGDYLVNSKADQLVVIVDACRSLRDDYAKGPDEQGRWSKGGTGYRTEVLNQPRYAHVYACTRYGQAGFRPAEGPDPDDGDLPEEARGYSYFTRALTELARDTTAPGALAELEQRLDEQVRTIAAADRGRSDQCVQITYATGPAGLLLFPDRGAPPKAGTHPWQRTAHEHEAWRRVRRGKLGEAQKRKAVNKVRDAVVQLVGRWGHDTDAGAVWLAEHGDLWRPSDSTAPDSGPPGRSGVEERMSLAVAGMLYDSAADPRDGQHTPSGLSLSEAALLVAGPFLYAAVGTRLALLAKELEPWSATPGPDRAALDRYRDGHRALRDRERRAHERGKDDEARAVAWWLARQWLLRVPARRDAVRDSGLAGLRELPDEPAFTHPLVREILDPERLWYVAELIGLDLEQWQPPDTDTVAAQLATEHTLDWHKTGTLLTLAHHMAVDPVLLSPLVAEHLGISDAVDGAQFRATLGRLTWQQEGRRRVLAAECAHQAVELALREHADALDRTVRRLLRGADGEQVLAWGVPAALGADKVAPGVGADRKPLYDPADVRFRLDGDRVRDLLMGEQLYQDRTLALRELYQNALDACRYRSARAQLFNHDHPGEPPDSWEGHIEFRQGREDGREFIECSDNGIGMGRHELRHLFAFAGSRFVEEREFLDERAEWEGKGIPFHPNSRFGIGVLSYFMLADEIRVTTTRMPREPGAGDRLVVDIDGPGALFRVRSEGMRAYSGTTVRLYLRESEEGVSCGKVLREHLWVSDFRVTVSEEGREPLEWLPGKLSLYREPVLDAGDGVWWSAGDGAVLADGVWAGESRFGAVVNLTGDDAPQLRLDRQAMLDDHEEYVARTLASKTEALFRGGEAVLSAEWLRRLVSGGSQEADTSMIMRKQGRLADLIAGEAARRGHVFSLVSTSDETEVKADPALVGCCPGDRNLVASAWGTGIVLTMARTHFAEWRAKVWAASVPQCGVRFTGAFPVGRPTDEVLLRYAEPPASIVPLGVVLSGAIATGLTTEEVACRLRELGRSLPDEALLPQLSRTFADIGRPLLDMLSQDGDGLAPWLADGSEIGIGHLLRFPGGLSETAHVLAALGFVVPGNEEIVEHEQREFPSSALERLAAMITRENLDSDNSELPRDRPVPPVHLVQALRIFPRQWKMISRVLSEAGYRLPPGFVPDPDLDFFLASRDGDGQAPEFFPGDRVPLYYVLSYAQRFGLTEETVVGRIRELGLVPPDLPGNTARHSLLRLSEETRRIYDNTGDGFAASAPVEPGTIIYLSRERGTTDDHIVELLTEADFTVRRLDEHPGTPLDYLDMVLSSRDFTGGPPWYDPSHPVPWHHVLHGTLSYDLSREEVIDRLTRTGCTLAPEPPAGDWSLSDDLTLIDRHLRPSHRKDRDWLPPDHPVPFTHILRAAHHLSRTPTQTARRLEQLGHLLPPDIEFTG